MRELTSRLVSAARRRLGLCAGRSDERGAALVLVGAGLVVTLAISALVIDMGHNLSEERRLQTATDAAALAAADAYSVGTAGCDAIAEDYLHRNVDDAVLVSCTATGDTATGTLGWVVVEAERPVTQFIASTIGRDTVTVRSESLAVFGAPDGEYEDPPPVGVCLKKLMTIPNFILWLLTGPSTTSTVIRLDFSPDYLYGCGTTGSSMALIRFDSAVNHGDELSTWFNAGYSDKVELGWYSGEPLALNGTHHAQLQSLVDDGTPFWMPIIADVQQNGPNAVMYVGHFIAARLLDFNVTGPPQGQYMEFLIDEGGIGAGCCALPGPLDLGARETALFALAEDGTPIGLN